MKRKMYRVELKGSNTLAREMALLACLSNGTQYIPLKDIEAVAKTELIRYPSLYENISINLIGENDLTIDHKTENLLVLTEVEIFEIDREISSQDARDILDELNPVLNRQGINNPDAHENLN